MTKTYQEAMEDLNVAAYAASRPSRHSRAVSAHHVTPPPVVKLRSNVRDVTVTLRDMCRLSPPDAGPIADGGVGHASRPDTTAA